jgi:nucleoside-diphosphate-sugar epimerase
VARALIVGCGCRGRSLGARLAAEGWAVRGTSRDHGRTGAIEAAGIEPAVADPERPGTVLDLIGDVAVVHWLLGSLRSEPDVEQAIHGRRLERLLEKLVESPVRGFVYEAAGGVEAANLERGAGFVRAAAETWRIPVEIVGTDPADHDAWLAAMVAATQRLVA